MRPFPFESKEAVSKETHALSKLVYNKQATGQASIDAWKFEASLKEVRFSIKACQDANRKTL